jgi:hypothetical protein
MQKTFEVCCQHNKEFARHLNAGHAKDVMFPSQGNQCKQPPVCPKTVPVQLKSAICSGLASRRASQEAEPSARNNCMATAIKLHNASGISIGHCVIARQPPMQSSVHATLGFLLLICLKILVDDGDGQEDPYIAQVMMGQPAAAAGGV